MSTSLRAPHAQCLQLLCKLSLLVKQLLCFGPLGSHDFRLKRCDFGLALVASRSMSKISDASARATMPYSPSPLNGRWLGPLSELACNVCAMPKRKGPIMSSKFMPGTNLSVRCRSNARPASTWCNAARSSVENIFSCVSCVSCVLKRMNE
jgi:hypothetical protein